MNAQTLSDMASKAANRASLYRLAGDTALAAQWAAVARGLYDAIRALETALEMESE